MNLQYQVADYNKNNYQCPHVDQNYDHKVLIYYPYTSDGDTFLFNQIEPKKYDLLVFPGFLNHLPIVHKTKRRISLQFEISCIEDINNIWSQK